MESIVQEEEMIFQESLSSKMDTLILFEGYPEDWSGENVEILGFSTGKPNELNATKLSEYFSMEDKKAEELLGFHGRDFYLAVENEGGEVITDNGVEFNRGDKDWRSADKVYVVERKAAVLGQGDISMRLVVW